MLTTNFLNNLFVVVLWLFAMEFQKCCYYFWIFLFECCFNFKPSKVLKKQIWTQRVSIFY